MEPGTPIWDTIAGSTIYDLSQPMRRGIPVSPNHPPFQMALMRRHGDMVREDGGSAANEIIVTGGHVGTHIDALCHVSQDGALHGGIDAAVAQGAGGFSTLGIDTVPPILCRGVLLDIAALKGVETLSPGYEITADDLEAAAALVHIRPGDAVLVRSGWARLWNEPAAFVGHDTGVPGVGPGAAEWLRDRRVRLTGGETIAYEVIAPGAGHRTLPVHRILLFEAGIHIIEMMNLEPLARDHIAEFLFIATPLKLEGATGSPIRPLAVR